MKSAFINLFIIVLSLSLSISQASEDTEDAEKKAIRKFFPKTLVQEFKRLSQSKDLTNSGKLFESRLVSETTNLEASGPSEKIILAVYSNMRSGAILLLKQNAGGSIGILQNLKLPIHGVYYPEITIFDLFDDGRSKIVVTFSAHVSTYKSYVLKWDGRKLSSVGPGKGFSSPTYDDINSDGLREVLEYQEYDEKHPEKAHRRIYSFKNGKYVPAGEMNALIRVGNDEDEKNPIDPKYDFKVPDTKTSYMVRIENGNLYGERRTGESQAAGIFERSRHRRTRAV